MILLDLRKQLINLSNSETHFKKPHVTLLRNSEKTLFKNYLTFLAFLGGFRNYFLIHRGAFLKPQEDIGKKFVEELLLWNKTKTSYLIYETPHRH
jgi:hypothetical protein